MKAFEKHLLKKIRQGDIKSFEFLFRLHYEPLLSYSVTITKSEADSEEVIQELFYRLWRDRTKLNIKHSISAYLYQSVFHNSLQVVKKGKLTEKYIQYSINQPRQDIDPEEILKYEELNRTFFELMEELPERPRQIFKMNRIQGLKYKEIADELSISLKTVEKNMTLSLKFFREKLKDYNFN
ncbi:MAG: RNA polymerase sigma-70 factor [Bacteroidales bacterium]|nr:RNA polymerase sigma-70 factor [Bacteroidales bacterium]